MKQGRNCNARLVVLSQPSRNLRHSLPTVVAYKAPESTP
jgi:hypothetical protein